MTFHYFIKSMANSYFNVRIRSGISSYNTIWRLRGDQGSQWKTAIVSIYEQREPFIIEIEGYAPGQAGIIAIDDIGFQNCAPPVGTKTGVCQPNQKRCQTNNVCINPYVFCDGVDDCGDAFDEMAVNCNKIMVPKCTFDYSSIYCNWTKERDQGSNAVWSYVKSGANTNQNRGTGPITDHTFRRMNVGSFLSLSGLPQDYGKKSRLITPMVKSNVGQTCALRFFYYMFGDNLQMGSLTVYLRYADPSITTKTVLFTKSGNSGQQWLRAIVPTPEQRPFQFVIEGQVGKGNEADIAIDDVSFSEGCIKSNQLAITITTGKPITSPKTDSPVVTGQPVTGGPVTSHPVTGQPVTGQPLPSGQTNSGKNNKPTKKPIGNSNPKTAGSHSKFQTNVCFQKPKFMYLY
jgi:hypothetical protein